MCLIHTYIHTYIRSVYTHINRRTCFIHTYTRIHSIYTYIYAYSQINRTTIEKSCITCERGKFGADPQRLSCETCYAGYLCFGNTTRGDPTNVTTEKGVVCPGKFVQPRVCVCVCVFIHMYDHTNITTEKGVVCPGKFVQPRARARVCVCVCVCVCLYTCVCMTIPTSRLRRVFCVRATFRYVVMEVFMA
jgi:hypothetical protein